MESALKWIRDNSDILFDLVRIYIGLGLAVRGLLVLMDPSFLNEWMGMFGLTGAAADAAQMYVIAAHLLGGALLSVGLLTRIASLVNIPILFGAVFFIHYPQGLLATDQSLELSALVLFLLALFAVRGSGRLSVMARIRAKKLSQDQT